MQKLNQIYEGKAKILYATDDQNLLIQYFKDDATAFNNLKKDRIERKGILNNYISEYLMLELAKANIPTHFIERLDERNQLVKKVTIIPLEVIVRNITAGSLSKKLNIAEGLVLDKPLFELYFKNDALGDPLLTEDHAITLLKIVSEKQLAEIRNYALSINKILQEIFRKINIKLVDFKIEFGVDSSGAVLLADEISPDSCRLWDTNTAEKLDKDRFRRDLGGLVEAYTEVATRLKINLPTN